MRGIEILLLQADSKRYRLAGVLHCEMLYIRQVGLGHFRAIATDEIADSIQQMIMRQSQARWRRVVFVGSPRSPLEIVRGNLILRKGFVHHGKK